MLFDTLQFHAMRGSLDALALRQKAISHNLANYETPGYKAKSVNFEDVMSGVRREGDTSGPYHFQAKVTTQNNTEVRPDGNNVDVEAEGLAMFETYLQSVYLYEKIGGQFTNMRYVLNQAFK